MKIIAINGSPRSNGNTAALLDQALAGARAQGAETQRVDLYRLNYRGCVSCFHCKRKDQPHGFCAMKDELSPLLEQLKKADAVIFGAPIYYNNIASGMVAFLERFLFSNYIYSEEIPTVFPKQLPSAFIYDMNITEAQAEKVHLSSNLEKYQQSITEVLGRAPELLYVYNTWQFSDYSKYESSIFDEADKRRWRAEQFPRDLSAAWDLGEGLATLVKHSEGGRR